MPEVLQEIEQAPLIVRTKPVLEMDDEQFFQFCQLNGDLRIERTAGGDIIIMPPAGGSSGSGNAELTYQFQAWARRNKKGRVFDSSTGFNLPNGATRSPDVAWVRRERLKKLPTEDWEGFLPLCPDFVLELRSPSDPLRRLKEKMQEYIDNGTQLGWLLDPGAERILVYQPHAQPKVLGHPTTISGEPVLPGFVLDVRQVWAALEHEK